MGKVCVSHDTLLITDNDSTTQDDKSPPPCMQLQAGVGFNFLPSNMNPPPRLQLRDGVGFFPPFLQVNERRRRRRAMCARRRHLPLFAPTTTTTTPPLTCNCETGWVFSSFFSSQRMPTMTTSHVGSLSSSAACLHLHDDDDDNPPPRLQLRDGVGFFHLFFQVNERRRRRRAM